MDYYERIDNTREQTDIPVIWICQDKKLASFHEVEGYSIRSLLTRESFLTFSRLLAENGYRFQ